MECIAARPCDIAQLSELSVRVGNIPFFPGQCMASLLVDKSEIVGFAAAQSAWHAAGSWVRSDYRGQSHTYAMRRILEAELRKSGVQVYFALPGDDFERKLFAKYGCKPVTERIVQVKEL